MEQSSNGLKWKYPQMESNGRGRVRGFHAGHAHQSWNHPMPGGPALSPTVPDAKSTAETRVMHQPSDQFNRNTKSYPPLVNNCVYNDEHSCTTAGHSHYGAQRKELSQPVHNPLIHRQTKMCTWTLHRGYSQPLQEPEQSASRALSRRSPDVIADGRHFPSRQRRTTRSAAGLVRGSS